MRPIKQKNAKDRYYEMIEKLEDRLNIQKDQRQKKIDEDYEIISQAYYMYYS